MARCANVTVMAACLTLLLLALGGSMLGAADARAIGDAKDRPTAVTNVTVTFTLDYQVAYGQGFVIAGNISQLGNWNPQNAPLMNISGVADWSLNVVLAQGTAFEFKPVLVYYDTKDVIEWYLGNNIVSVASSTLQIVLSWPGNRIIKEVI